MAYRILMVGPPLAGKGTQSKMLSSSLGIKHISSGDILRAESLKNTPLSLDIQTKLKRGEFIPDEVVRMLVNRSISTLKEGFILDGYPRTLPQLEAIDFYYDKIIFINTPLDTLLERARGRLYHPKSGRVYHKVFNPPRIEGVDDTTGDPLIEREDDREEIVRHRFLDFTDKTGKVIKRGMEMGKVSVIDGSLGVGEVHRRIMDVL